MGNRKVILKPIYLLIALCVGYSTWVLLQLKRSASSPEPQVKLDTPIHSAQDRKIASVAPVAVFQAPWVSQSLKEIQELKNCLQEGSQCAIPNRDSREQDLSVDRQISQKVASLLDRKAGMDGYPIVDELADFEGDYTRSSLIELMGTLPARDKNVEIVSAMLGQTTSPEVFRLGILELSRYMQTSMKDDILGALGESLLHGPFHAGKYLPGNLEPLLNDRDSIAYFEKILKSLPHQSERYENLKAILEEKKRALSGG